VCSESTKSTPDIILGTFVSRLQSDEILESICAQPKDYLLVSRVNICHTQNAKRYAQLYKILSLSLCIFEAFVDPPSKITIFLSPENHCHNTILFPHLSIGDNLESPP
jgi:hypothetical protein